MTRLKQLRLEKGMSQSELSKAVGVSPKYISFLENGERTPSLRIAKRIADFFRVQIEDIFLK
ncbi:helix-turn-helix transcriptional regulator [Peptoniphilus sp. MSJ-1]|uniref:Helix-turn-helix transcriptional regulator n=1 Tax=Peptoniphilus ovalis TaxID=2841503 RepID=A0ABS6FHC6_9FIRM|nr:helix-turn-helix transcriptional regulator [Peptoniphilus ovalis]